MQKGVKFCTRHGRVVSKGWEEALAQMKMLLMQEHKARRGEGGGAKIGTGEGDGIGLV